MIKQILRIIAIICTLALTLGWMTLIYGLSSQTATESGSLSAVIAQPITDALAKWKDLTEEEKAALYYQVDSNVRVVAHFSEYALLGILVTMFCRLLHWRSVWIPWLICTVYAVTDEWHQSYTAGRASELKDVIVDTTGVIFGIILLCLLRKVWRSKHVRRS